MGKIQKSNGFLPSLALGLLVSLCAASAAQASVRDLFELLTGRGSAVSLRPSEGHYEGTLLDQSTPESELREKLVSAEVAPTGAAAPAGATVMEQLELKETAGEALWSFELRWLKGRRIELRPRGSLTAALGALPVELLSENPRAEGLAGCYVTAPTSQAAPRARLCLDPQRSLKLEVMDPRGQVVYRLNLGRFDARDGLLAAR